MNGALVERRLLELEWTPEQFAEVAGFSTSTAYNIISGKPVSRKNLFRAAKALKVKATDLLISSQPTEAVMDDVAT